MICDKCIHNNVCCDEGKDEGLTFCADFMEERPKGKWIKRFYFRESSNCYDLEMKVCSECRDECSWDAETGVSKYNFCPNCGADMRQEANE